jgi:hypothetical protein
MWKTGSGGSDNNDDDDNSRERTDKASERAIHGEGNTNNAMNTNGGQNVSDYSKQQFLLNSNNKLGLNRMGNLSNLVNSYLIQTETGVVIKKKLTLIQPSVQSNKENNFATNLK